VDDKQQPKLVLHYKGNLTKAGLILTGVLAPIWAGWSLYVAGWLGKAVILGGIVGYWDLALLFCFYVALFLLGLATIFVCLDNKIVLTGNGLEVPWHHLFEMVFERRRTWKDLVAVEFRHQNLRLIFATMGGVTFNMDGFNAAELKDFCVAIKSNAPDVQFSFDQKAIAMGIPGIKAATTKAAGFTATWEDDLASRFGTTAYVPLEAGAELQDRRLTVVGQVSFGGLSAVYLCRTADGEMAILKEAVVPLNSDEASRTKALEMFDREARLLKSLRHQNIARVLDHFVENNHNYLLLQHIEGMDLRQYIRENGPQSERIVLRWALEIAEILTYLHSHEPIIIHRDLTPDNLVLDKSGSLKLIDFGAANELIGTATGTLVGKQSYISPEQFRGKAKPASDIYSLGCTLFFLATGKDPEALSQSSLAETEAKNMPTLSKLIADCTALEVEERVASAHDVSNRARKYLNEAVVKAAED
jgi:Protein kinase domain